MENYGTALEKNATELTVVDVYDVAAVIGHEFERIIDRYGCDALLRLMPKVVRVLELLEVLVSRSAANPETEELRRELDRLRRERNDRYEKEKIHQQELELVEDAWRGEAQDLLSQIAQLQAENQRLLVRLSLQDSPITGEELQKHEGMSEKEQQVMKKLKDMVDKQRDEIRAKDHELSLRNEDVEALQMQQHRLMRINQDLRHRIGTMEAQGKALIQLRAELEAAAQARQQELRALQLEVTRLRKEHHGWEQEREFAEKDESFPTMSGISTPKSAKAISLVEAAADSIKQNSVWEECGGDSGFLPNCFESEKNLPLLASSTNRKESNEDCSEDEEKPALLLGAVSEEEPEEESDRPRFTLQELRDVLQERNELKAQVFMLLEELAYYKSEDLEDEDSSDALVPVSPPRAATADQPESGIRRLFSMFSRNQRMPGGAVKV
ncbi:RILP-like protein 1 isoform X2 [Lampris incognitus]|uniref:RILP-like protein 1 isoform X2 n=1 Tax=Lampris incognitus TaxID=2546036 RepID=UPI0024B62FF2|nr:RILP-like protein 1 isoform X2 [Lampris incognitus]